MLPSNVRELGRLGGGKAGSAMTDEGKTLTGYCEPWTLRAGETVRLMASRLAPGDAQLDLVRIVCGDPGRAGPGFEEAPVASALPATVTLDAQPLVPGSYGEIGLSGLVVEQRLVLALTFMATRPGADQTVAAVVGEHGVLLELSVDAGRALVRCGEQTLTLRERPLDPSRWYTCELELGTGEAGLRATLVPRRGPSPGQDAAEDFRPAVAVGAWPADLPQRLRRLLLAAAPDGRRFDGRVARPALEIDDARLRWDLSQGPGGRRIVDASGHDRHGLLHQLPARAVAGPAWDGTVHAWTVDPAHYDAVHFHGDDLYDAGWPVTAELALPEDLPSGIYAFRLRAGEETDRVPFFVRPARDAPTADVALLMPTCTYMAYANHRMLFEGADFVAARAKLRPEHAYVRDHPALGRSLYEKHADGSGVMFSSRRRPVLQTRPGADGWNFTPDTVLNAFIEHTGIRHDVLTDEDVHEEGIGALAPYRVLVTGTHPEYWSSAMLDALEEWLREGGRLMYLGGNGFYWRVAFSEAWPGAIELRRAEDGVRNWATPPGESYHAFDGEYGGLWRRLGRAPNALVGIGFVAQGFERATHYTRTAASRDPRAAWIFEGVEGDDIGTSGLGGGAAGQEVDAANPALGTPAHALVVAQATAFGPDMSRTKEELDASILVPSPDPLVRADMVFFESCAGGAVFSVGSIAWFGALAREDWDNDVARITANVLRRFADPEPFPPPPPVD